MGDIVPRYGSVCSGIEAASVAWHSVGWMAAWLAEIEPFPAAVLGHHYPDVPNYGDMTALAARVRELEIEAPDVLVGGTPCQAFSVAGLRQSLDDDRGQLTIKFLELADAIDTVRRTRGEPECIIVWENVPGVLNTKDNAFGCFLAGLAGESEPLLPAGGRWTDAGCVYGPTRTVAWRVLDAQYFGLAQRRRRVFVVASARNGFDPAAVLFEFNGVRRDTAPSREAGKVAPTIPARSTGGGGLGTDFDCDGGVITMAHGQGGAEIGFDRGPTLTCNHEAPIVAFHPSQDPINSDDGSTHALGCGSSGGQASIAVAYPIDMRNALRDPDKRDAQNRQGCGLGDEGDPAPTLTKAHVHGVACVAVAGTMKACAGSGGWTNSADHAAAGYMVPMAVLQPITQFGDIAGSLTARHDSSLCADRGQNVVAQPIGVTLHGTDGTKSVASFTDLSSSLRSRIPSGVENSTTTAVMHSMQVRRLTPVECERLQGFPDNYTAIPWRKKPASECPDGPRYKALGNSMAVPVMRWIGERIDNHIFYRGE